MAADNMFDNDVWSQDNTWTQDSNPNSPKNNKFKAPYGLSTDDHGTLQGDRLILNDAGKKQAFNYMTTQQQASNPTSFGDNLQALGQGVGGGVGKDIQRYALAKGLLRILGI